MNLIRYIWDFRGRDAEATARHHAVHLGQFLENNLPALEAEVSGNGEVWSAFIDLDQLPQALLQEVPEELRKRSAESTLPADSADGLGRTLRPNRYELLEG